MNDLYIADQGNKEVVMKMFVKTLLALSALALVTGCSRLGSTVDAADNHCGIEVFMNGPQNILYFDCKSREFTRALADYQEGHPNTRIVAFSNDSTAGYGYDTGYTVVTEPYEMQEQTWAPH